MSTPARTPPHVASDTRPRVWIGHIGPVPVPDVSSAAEFYLALGCRLVMSRENLAILELRGGTHLLVQPGDPEPGTASPFDLMVDDLDATHAAYTEAGLDPTEIIDGSIHRRFSLVDPGERTVTVNDSHVIGAV